MSCAVVSGTVLASSHGTSGCFPVSKGEYLLLGWLCWVLEACCGTGSAGPSGSLVFRWD